MISERYFCNESDRISCRKVGALVAVIAVRKRLMKAVFFFRAESRLELMGKVSVHAISCTLPRLAR